MTISGTVGATLTLTPDEARAVAVALSECLDAADTAITVSEIDAATWSVDLHFAERPDPAALRELIAALAGSSAARRLWFRPVAERDWVAASLAGLSPVEAGRFTVHGSHDRRRIPRRLVPIEIDAALAFGTGHHGTTRGCLLALDAILKARRPRRILDIGTGTGVLAIAAARALRQPVVASDIDRTAVRVACANARANGVGAYLRLIGASGASARELRQRAPYTLILANILLAPLMRMAASLARLSNAGGIVVLSGLLPHQANAALTAYRACGFRLERRRDLEGWTTLTIARGAASQPRRPNRLKRKRPGRR
jgi:ribosomal protein L11 methyltransferase